MTRPLPNKVGYAARTLIAATAVSALGNSMYIGAAALLVLELTRNAASVPLIAICGGLPAILLAPVVPRAIDRFGAGRVAIVADLISAVAASVYPVLVLLSLHSGPWIVYGQEVVIGAGAAFYSTASRILVTGLSASSSSVLVRINGYSIATTQIAGVVGWGLGALTFALSNAATAMLVNAVTFVVSAWLQWRVRAELRTAVQRESGSGPDTPAPALLRRSLTYSSRVLTLGGLLLVFSTTQRLWLSNYPAILVLVLGHPDWSLGVANVAYSAGAILAGIAVASRVANPSARAGAAATCGFYVLCVLVSFMSPLLPMLALYCLVGVASIGTTLVQSRLQLDLPLASQPAFFSRLLAVQSAGNLIFLSLWISLLKVSDPRTLIVVALAAALFLTVLLGMVRHDRSTDHIGQ